MYELKWREGGERECRREKEESGESVCERVCVCAGLLGGSVVG